jgi:hypothetical protein
MPSYLRSTQTGKRLISSVLPLASAGRTGTSGRRWIARSPAGPSASSTSATWNASVSASAWETCSSDAPKCRPSARERASPW